MSETKYRSAITGEYVTEEYAKENPDTTVSEVDGEVQPHDIVIVAPTEEGGDPE